LYEVGIEVLLHLFDGLLPGLAAGDAEVLVEQGAVQALDKAVGLGRLTLVVRCSMSSCWRNSS
jgi:hypothetical protein